MLRNSTILISYHGLSCLRIIAQLDGQGCAENALELILARYLDTRPEIADLAHMEQAAKKQARKDWEAKWNREEDKLPE